MQAFHAIQEAKLLTWTPANVYRLRYRPRLWGYGIDTMEAFIEADSAAEAVRILREELRGLCSCIEVIARYRAQCNFCGVPVNGGRVPVGAADAGRLQAAAGRPAPFPFPAT